MKLTKGKISKLYRKNKQSLKRYKKKETKQNKSFRKSTHVNLRNKSLKNLRGGKDKEEESEKKNKTLLPPAPASGLPVEKAPETLEDSNPPNLTQESLSKPVLNNLKQENTSVDFSQKSVSEPSTKIETLPNNSQDGSDVLDVTTNQQPVVEKETSSPEQTESPQKALEEIPEVTDSQANASPFLAEVKAEKEGEPTEQTGETPMTGETGEVQKTEEGGPSQTTEETGEVQKTEEGGPSQTTEETGQVQTTEEGGPSQTTEETGQVQTTEEGQTTEEPEQMQTTEETGQMQTTEEGGPSQTTEETGQMQTTEEGQTTEETGQMQTTEEGGPSQTTEEGQTTEEPGQMQTTEESGPQENQMVKTAPSDQGLPENVSIAAKTIMDYAIGSLARQINSGTTISQGVQNPESAFTNMTNTFASKGGRSLKKKLRIKGKNTRKHIM